MARFFNSLVLVMLAVMPALAVEDLRGILYLVNPTDVTLYGTAHDLNNQNNTFRVQVCWDDPTLVLNCDQPVLADTTSLPAATCSGTACRGFHYLVPTGTVGAVQPRDGNQHLMYAKIISNANPGQGDSEIDGSPWPFQLKSGVVAPMWVANLETTPARLAASQFAILANSQDPYSVGTSGNVVCTVGSTTVRDDGVAGYFALRHHVPCANVVMVSVPVAQTLPQITFYSAIVPALQGLPASVQAIAIAWAQPSLVANTSGLYRIQSISAAVANAGLVTGTGCYDGSPFLGQGPVNPYFNSSSQAPFTDHQIRPAMMLAGEKCPTCQATNNYTFPWVEDFPTAKSTIDAAIAATDTNPSGSNVYWTLTSDLKRSQTTMLVSPLELGNALSPYTNAQILGSLSSPASSITVSAKNILLYEISAPHWMYSSPTFVPGAGAGYAVTSTSGALPSDGSQTTAASWISQGAVGAYGNAAEPCELLAYKDPDAALFIPNYTQGQTLIEALWKSVRLPWGGNFLGDPLAAPFSLQNGQNQSAPILSSVSPSSMSPGASVPVTLTGQNFTVPATVAVQGPGVTVSGVNVLNATSIVALFTIAANTTPGTYFAKVTTSSGVSENASFLVGSTVPTLTSLSPVSGNAGTTLAVTLTGQNFTSPVTVAVQGQGITVSGVTVVSTTKITATFAIAANAASGTYNVSVTTPSGLSGGVPFQVQAGSGVPVLTSLLPSSGVAGSAVPITLTGANFTPATSLRLSGAGASIGGSAVVVNSAQITATFTLSATALLGVHNVYVVDPAGTSNILPFTVNPPSTAPVISSITPSGGTPGNGVNVTVAGSNFISGASVNVSGSGVTTSNIVVVSATRMQAILNVAASAATGSYNVSVSTTGGTSGTVPFTVGAASPVLTSVSPASGTVGTAVNVTLAGSNFISGASVNVSGSGITASNMTVVNSTQIQAILNVAASATTGSYSVSVSTSGGTSGTVSFTVGAASPVLTSVSPTSGTVGTAVNVTLTGSNFISGASVNVSGSGITASNMTVVSSTQIQAILNIAASAITGSYNVSVSTSGGTSGTAPFAVGAAPPVLSAVSPASGTAGSAINVTLSGSNFAGGAAISISGSGVTAVNTVVANSGQITATFVIASNAVPGPYAVQVTGANGSSGQFTFNVSASNNVPTITSVTPAAGGRGTIVSVTITGTNFVSGTGLRLSGLGASVGGSAVLVDPTKMTATFTLSPTAVLGVHNVCVVTPAGTSNIVPFIVY